MELKTWKNIISRSLLRLWANSVDYVTELIHNHYGQINNYSSSHSLPCVIRASAWRDVPCVFFLIKQYSAEVRHEISFVCPIPKRSSGTFEPCDGRSCCIDSSGIFRKQSILRRACRGTL